MSQIASSDGLPSYLGIFPGIFAVFLAIIVGAWVLTAVVLGRNIRILRRNGIDPTTVGSQFAVRMLNGAAPGPAPAAAAGLSPLIAPGTAPGIEQRLAELTDLRDRGIVNPQEYDTQRARIIASA